MNIKTPNLPEWRPEYPKTDEEIDLDNEAREQAEDLRESQEREERIK